MKLVKSQILIALNQLDRMYIMNEQSIKSNQRSQFIIITTLGCITDKSQQVSIFELSFKLTIQTYRQFKKRQDSQHSKNRIKKLMRTIIYNEKHHPDHVYSGSYTNGPYIQSSNLPPRKSNTMKKIQSTAPSSKNSREIHHLHIDLNEQHQQSLHTNHINVQLPSPLINKAKKPTQKPVQNIQTSQASQTSQTSNPLAQYFVKQYNKIEKNLEIYKKIYQLKLSKQIQTCSEYFKSLMNMVLEEKNQSIKAIKIKSQEMIEKINLQIGAIATKISTLKNGIISQQKQIQELRSQQEMEIPLFRVETPSIQKMRENLKISVFITISEDDLKRQFKESRALSITSQFQDQKTIKKQDSQKLQLQDTSAEQIQKMTPIPQRQDTIQILKFSDHLQDKDLYCNQDIENILKDNNKIGRKRRYECRQETIPEESQSHEDSGILSQNDTLNQSRVY